MATTITDHQDSREVRRLLRDMGIDLAEVPPILTPKEAAPLLGMSVDALSQDRVGGHPTIPYCKVGKRVRYLRADIVRNLLANRVGGVV